MSCLLLFSGIYFFDFWIINGYFYLWHDLNLPALFNLISALLCTCKFVGPSWSTYRIKYKSVWWRMTKPSSFLLSPSLSRGEFSLDSTAWKHMFACIRPECRIILGKKRKKNNVLMPSLVNANSQKCHWHLSMWEQGIAKAPICWHSAACCWPPSVPGLFRCKLRWGVVLSECYLVHADAILTWVWVRISALHRVKCKCLWHVDVTDIQF